MWQRIYPKPTPIVTQGLLELKETAAKRGKYHSDESKYTKASHELDTSLVFFSFVYGVTATDLATALDTSEGTIRRRVKRGINTPTNHDINDPIQFVDEPQNSDGTDRYLIRLTVNPSNHQRFEADITRRAEDSIPTDYSSNPDMELPVATSIEDLFDIAHRHSIRTPFYVTEDVYNYLLGNE